MTPGLKHAVKKDGPANAGKKIKGKKRHILHSRTDRYGPPSQRRQHQHAAIAILDVGWMDDGVQQQA